MTSQISETHARAPHFQFVDQIRMFTHRKICSSSLDILGRSRRADSHHPSTIRRRAHPSARAPPADSLRPPLFWNLAPGHYCLLPGIFAFRTKRQEESVPIALRRPVAIDPSCRVCSRIGSTTRSFPVCLDTSSIPDHQLPSSADAAIESAVCSTEDMSGSRPLIDRGHANYGIVVHFRPTAKNPPWAKCWDCRTLHLAAAGYSDM